MSSEEAKAIHEVEIFSNFLSAAKVYPPPESIEKRKPPEPDILCEFSTGDALAFELVEICDPNLAAAFSNPFDDRIVYVRTSDPTARIIRKKLSKEYSTDGPVELLCYTAGRTATPPSLIAGIARLYACSVRHRYRKVWLYSRRNVQLLWTEA